ncbi:hypothetical protein CC1G_02413 [Coprinopsis cinerea okayama7|uniref:Uncharacterized protein n=1 Tax=Coprinopsis cinerea (strain Okayama-7 / 130 / ATCC MYA-4618 / FGSC 9003) TaxID=240176 RepID=A8NBF3_COPC7|nr:hypothetical protein CC1G_02413 [Coprinopsis cinerea okayama7\|eukprot:XP_001832151.1 hypothetical protein CC1G_02413 [Coprinopsis cinerea okayama7\
MAYPPIANVRSKSTSEAYNPPTYPASRGKPTRAKPAGGSHSFRPNLPKDPFAARPWIVDFDALPLNSARQHQTILVIGTPPQADLHALVYSSLLKDSFLLIATHDVKPLDSLLLLSPSESTKPAYGPTTRILRLAVPLFTTSQTSSVTSLPATGGAGAGGSDALRLMSLLARASQVVNALEASNPSITSTPPGGVVPASTRIQQLSEDPVTGEFAVVEVLGSTSGAALRTFPNGHGEIPTPPPPPNSKKSKRQTLHGLFGFGSNSSSPSADSGSTSPASPTPHLSNSAIQRAGVNGFANFASTAYPRPGEGGGGTRAFDALINYLPSPSTIPEKVLLKQAILVTTLSAPYLSTKDDSSPPPLSLASSPGLVTPSKSKERRHTSMLGIPLRRLTSRTSSSGHEGDPPESSKRNTLSRRISTKDLGRKFSGKVGGNGVSSLPPLTSRGGEDDHDWEKVDGLRRYRGSAHLIHVLPDSSVLWGSQPGSASGSGSNLAATSSNTNTHTPTSKPKLVTSIEQFVLAFAFPLGVSLRGSSSSHAVVVKGDGSRDGRGNTVIPSKSTPALHKTAVDAPLDATQRGRGGALMPSILVRETSAGPYAGSSRGGGGGGGGAAGSTGGEKPIPYIVRAGVMGGQLSISYSFSNPDYPTTDNDPPADLQHPDTQNGQVVLTLSILDLLVFGAFDGSVGEHGGGKAWLGGVGVREVVEGLGRGASMGGLGNCHPVDVRPPSTSVVIDTVWIGAVDPKRGSERSRERDRDREKDRDRYSPPPVVPPKDDLSGLDNWARVGQGQGQGYGRTLHSPGSMPTSEYPHGASRASQHHRLPPSRTSDEQYYEPAPRASSDQYHHQSQHPHHHHHHHQSQHHHQPQHQHRSQHQHEPTSKTTSNKVSRKPAPTIPASDSLMAAWEAVTAANNHQVKGEGVQVDGEVVDDGRLGEQKIWDGQNEQKVGEGQGEQKVREGKEKTKDKDGRERRERDKEKEREREARRERRESRRTRDGEKTRASGGRERSASRSRRRSEDEARDRERERRYVEEEVRERERERRHRRASESRNRDRSRERAERPREDLHREQVRESGRERRRERETTGLLTPPVSGSEVEVDVDVELEDGLDSPGVEGKGMGLALIGESGKSRRRDRDRDHRDYNRFDQDSTPRELRTERHEHSRSRSGREKRISSSRPPSLVRRDTGASGDQVQDGRVPPSASSESAAKVGNESFDIAAYYEYDRTKCEKQRRERKESERDRRGSREREKDREKDKEKEREKRRKEREKEREKDKNKERDGERERRKERSGDRERERRDKPDIDYNRGGMGPPPSSRHTRDSREAEGGRRSSSRHRRESREDQGDDREQRRRRHKSSAGTRRQTQSEEGRDIYYVTYNGEMKESRSAVRYDDVPGLADVLREDGRCSMAGIPPNFDPEAAAAAASAPTKHRTRRSTEDGESRRRHKSESSKARRSEAIELVEGSSSSNQRHREDRERDREQDLSLLLRPDQSRQVGKRSSASRLGEVVGKVMSMAGSPERVQRTRMQPVIG